MFTPETNIILYVNFTSFKKYIHKERDKEKKKEKDEDDAVFHLSHT